MTTVRAMGACPKILFAVVLSMHQVSNVYPPRPFRGPRVVRCNLDWSSCRFPLRN